MKFSLSDGKTGPPTFTVQFFDEDWCEILNLTRRYAKPGEVVQVAEWFVDLRIRLNKGQEVSINADVIPVGMSVEVDHG